MEIFATAVSHVDNSVNGQGTRTLSAIESEVPTFAAVYCSREFSMHPSGKHEEQYQKSFL